MSIKLKDLPDHHDAELVLKLYELRTEPLMRESRSLLSKDFWPTTLKELQAWRKSDHPGNGAFRQVTSYWEMAFGMVRHGVLHGDGHHDHRNDERQHVCAADRQGNVAEELPRLFLHETRSWWRDP